MDFNFKTYRDELLPFYNLRLYPDTSAIELAKDRHYVYRYNYSLPAKVEEVKNEPMTEDALRAHRKEGRFRYYRKTPVLGQAPVYFDDPVRNAFMDATKPRPYEARAKITCSRCWRGIVKHLERVGNNITVCIKKLVYS